MCPESRSLPRALESWGKEDLVTGTPDTWPSSEVTHSEEGDLADQGKSYRNLGKTQKFNSKAVIFMMGRWVLWNVMQNIYACLCFFRGLGRGGRKMGFLECTALWDCKQVRGLCCVDSGPVSVLPAGFAGSLQLLGVRPIRVVITTCYWSTQCTSVFPQCLSWLLVTMGTSEWGLWQGASYRTLHLTGRPCAATPWDWLATVLSDKGRPQRTCAKERAEGEPGASFHLIRFKVYKLLWGGKPTLITKFTWHFPNKKEFVTRATFFFPLKKYTNLGTFLRKNKTSFKLIWTT